MMLVAGSYEGTGLEETLRAVDEPDVGRRFVRLAGGELDRAYRLAGLILGDRSAAEDAVQDALLRAWNAAGSLRDPSGFQAWFDRILVNVCRDRLRRQRTVRFVAVGPAQHQIEDGDPFGAVLERDEALRALAGLPADERVVLILHYWADLSLEGVADRLGWRTATVKSRLHRGLTRIRTRLQADGTEGVAR